MFIFIDQEYDLLTIKEEEKNLSGTWLYLYSSVHLIYPKLFHILYAYQQQMPAVIIKYWGNLYHEKVPSSFHHSSSSVASLLPLESAANQWGRPWHMQIYFFLSLLLCFSLIYNIHAKILGLLTCFSCIKLNASHFGTDPVFLFLLQTSEALVWIRT